MAGPRVTKRPKTLSKEKYDVVADYIQTNAHRIRREFNEFMATGKNLEYHERYVREFEALVKQYKHLPEAERNAFVHDLLKSDQYSFPHSFMVQMMEIVNELHFWMENEAEWECDEESVARRNGKPPHWITQIDDSYEANVHHDPKLRRRTSILLN